jgi:hypothetical protein
MTFMPNTTASPAAARAGGPLRDAAAVVRDSLLLPIRYRPVSGRYRGRQGGFEVELRVDVDGARSMNRVSADYYRLQGGETVYAGSTRIDAPIVVAPRHKPHQGHYSPPSSGGAAGERDAEPRGTERTRACTVGVHL